MLLVYIKGRSTSKQPTSSSRLGQSLVVIHIPRNQAFSLLLFLLFAILLLLLLFLALVVLLTGVLARRGLTLPVLLQISFLKIVLDLVVDKIVQSNDAPDQSAEVNDHVHVIGLDQHGLDKLVDVEIGEEVEDGLHVGHDLLVDLHPTLDDGLEVVLHLHELLGQGRKAGHLGLDEGGDGRHGGVVDVTEQVLDANLLRFFGPDEGWDVGEGAVHLGRLGAAGTTRGGGGVDLLDHAVGRGGDGFPIGTDVDDDKDRRGRRLGRHKALEEGMDTKVVGADLRSGGIKSDHPLLGIDFAEHVKHVLEEVVIQIEHSLWYYQTGSARVWPKINEIRGQMYVCAQDTAAFKVQLCEETQVGPTICQYTAQKPTGFFESSSNGTANEFVASTRPLDTVPSRTPTARLRVPRATRW